MSKEVEDSESTVEVEADVIPTCDTEAPSATYRNYRPEDTRIIVYSVGRLGYPGRPVDTRDQALADCKRVFGKVLEANYVPGRAFLRVMR